MSKFNFDEETKAELLRLVEAVSKESVESAFKIAEILIKKSTNKFDDLLLPALPFIKEKIDDLLDNISDVE